MKSGTKLIIFTIICLIIIFFGFFATAFKSCCTGENFKTNICETIKKTPESTSSPKPTSIFNTPLKK